MYSPVIFLLVIAGSLLSFIYSAPPIRAKRYIILNLILNSLGFSLLFLIGFVTLNRHTTFSSIMMTSFFAIFFIPIQIIHQVSHYQEDKEQNISTLYNRYGVKTTLYFIIGSFICLTVLALLITVIGQKNITFFISTFLLSLVLSIAMHNFGKDNKYNSYKAIKIRLFTRKVSIIYGVIIGIIFLI